MMGNNASSAAAQPHAKPRREGLWVQAFKRLLKDRAAMIGLIGVLVLVILAVFAPLFTAYSPDEMDPTCLNAGPSWQHIFGTDSLGRDYFTRCLYGGRYSLALGLLSSILAMLIGLFLGTLAGFFGGWVETVIMRFCDVMQSIPAMMISIVVSLTLGTGYFVTIIALAVGGFSFSTRLTRAQILTIRESQYLEAAKTINCGSLRIMFRHALPNVMSPMILDCTMKVAQMIQISAALSVIGLGVQPPTPEWGAMLSAGRNVIRNYPHLVIFPGLFIIAISLFINMFGDGLRDALDPKLKK